MIVGVFGSARDGSTLLQRLLDGSPDLWMYPIEIKFFAQLAWPRRWSLTRRRTVRAEGLRHYAEHQLRELARHYVSQLAEPLPVPRVTVPLAHRGRVPSGDALRWFLSLTNAAYAREGERTLAFKTTEAMDKDLYERALPELRAVHIVRDPLTQFSSTKRTVCERPGFLFWYGNGDIATTFVRRWRAHAEHAVARVAAAPDRNLIVRYEDLRTDALGEVRRVCEWLGIRAPAEPTLQTVLGGRRLNRLPDNPSGAGLRTPEQVVADTAALFGYAEVASRDELSFVAAHTSRTAAALGYDVAADRVEAHDARPARPSE